MDWDWDQSGSINPISGEEIIFYFDVRQSHSSTIMTYDARKELLVLEDRTVNDMWTLGSWFHLGNVSFAELIDIQSYIYPVAHWT